MTRVAFLGTPEASVPSLMALDEEFDVVSVISQPDRPKGRGRSMGRSPVAEAADELGIPVLQPPGRERLAVTLDELPPLDVAVVVAYGRILTPEMLETSRLGFINLHFSLLPRWRGAAPVQRAVMAGDSMSGVSIIKLDEGMDTGPVLNAQAIDIGDQTTGGDLESSLARVGARLLAATLSAYVDGEIEPVPQTDEGATYAPKLTSSDRSVLPSEPREVTRNRIRALNPTPGATLTIDGESFKILRVDESKSSPEEGTWAVIDGWPVIGCADGGLRMTSLQPPGKPIRSGDEWVRGARKSAGKLS